jgi:hypothetical protein
MLFALVLFLNYSPENPLQVANETLLLFYS